MRGERGVEVPDQLEGDRLRPLRRDDGDVQSLRRAAPVRADLSRQLRAEEPRLSPDEGKALLRAQRPLSPAPHGGVGKSLPVLRAAIVAAALWAGALLVVTAAHASVIEQVWGQPCGDGVTPYWYEVDGVPVVPPPTPAVAIAALPIPDCSSVPCTVPPRPIFPRECGDIEGTGTVLCGDMVLDYPASRAAKRGIFHWRPDAVTAGSAPPPAFECHE